MGYAADKFSTGLLLLAYTLCQGYAAGNAVPSPVKNVEKDFLKKYWARWKASHTGRWYLFPF